MPDVKVSPTTGNPLVGNPSWGYQDSVTGQTFTSDQIDGSAIESESPLDYIGGAGVGKMFFKDAEIVGEKALAKIAAKKAAKKTKCPTCTGAQKAAKDGTLDAKDIRSAQDAHPSAVTDGSTPTYRGDTRSLDEVNGDIKGTNPDANISLDDHMQTSRPDGSQWVSASKSPDVAASYAQNPNAVMGAPQNGQIWEVYQPGGVDVSRTSLGEYGNQEVAYPNGILNSNVSRTADVPAGFVWGDPVTWQPNPNFTPR